MDRISALRNVEDALRAFEAGEADLAETERQVVAVLRTYATEFEGDEQSDLATYRASGDDAVDGTVVVAASAAEARRRVADLVDADHDFAVSRLDP
jgi:Tfp pilus assembly protein PilX